MPAVSPSGVAVRHPDRRGPQGERGIDPEDEDGGAGPEHSGGAVDRHGCLQGGRGQVLTQAGRNELVEQ
jgi:hypothetical protein